MQLVLPSVAAPGGHMASFNWLLWNHILLFEELSGGDTWRRICRGRSESGRGRASPGGGCFLQRRLEGQIRGYWKKDILREKAERKGERGTWAAGRSSLGWPLGDIFGRGRNQRKGRSFSFWRVGERSYRKQSFKEKKRRGVWRGFPGSLGEELQRGSFRELRETFLRSKLESRELWGAGKASLLKEKDWRKQARYVLVS